MSAPEPTPPTGASVSQTSVQPSLAASRPRGLSASMGRFAKVMRRLPAWLSLVTVFTLVLALTLQRDVHRETLSGPWTVRTTRPDGTLQESTITLPGMFVGQGIPSDARVLAVRDVVSDGEPMALLVDRPLYALTVTWDGVPLGSAGDPSASGRDARTSRSLFVTPPVSPAGTHHQLGLDLKGEYGKGGITGRILLGPVPDVHAAGVAIEVQRLAFALGLSLLAALPLVVAARGAWRPTYILFGLLASVLAVQSFAQSNLIYDFLPDALAATRLLRFVTPLVPVFGTAYVTWFVHGRSLPSDRAMSGAGLTLSAFALVLPGSWFPLLEIGSEILYVIGTLLYVRLAIHGVRDRLPGSLLLAAAVLPVLWSIGVEILITHGLHAGASDVLTSALLFTGALGSALVLRDASTSEQHERLVRGSLDAMVTVDPGGRIRDANPAAHRLLTPPSADAPFLHFVSDPDRPWVRAHLVRALIQADRIEFRTTQNRVLESLATPLGPEMLMLTLRDITIRRELDRGLLHAARMETVALLLGGIAHDFNNMLSTLLAHLGMLRTQITDVRTRERLDRMEGAVDRASELTRRLLTVARGTGSELVSVDLATVVAGANELVEPTLSAGVTLRVELPANLPPVLGAPGDLEQVIVNLLMNARDAVGERGTIRVVARTFRQGETRAGEDAKRGVALMVEDDGPGVATDRQEEVFQPFVTTKPHGTGLGLAVARQILRDHHGRIWVESRPGGGSRFLLALRHADAVDEAPTPMPKGRSVLLVEDEQVLLEDYGQALTEAGYTVAAFSDGTAGADWLTRNEPDLVVTDVVMPGINGLDLARLSLELHPETPVLFVSAFVPHEALRHLPEGTWQALHKPVRAARLVATVGRIRRSCERKASGDDEITWVNYLFPDLADLSARRIGFDQESRT